MGLRTGLYTTIKGQSLIKISSSCHFEAVRGYFSLSCSTYIPESQISSHGINTPTLALNLEPVLHYRLSITTISTAKVMEWLSRLCSFLLNNTRGPATPEPLSPPGSLRDTHEAACAWYLGPRAENADYLKMYVEIILNDLVQCRRNFSQDDEVSISSSSCLMT
jgi:hypothetical protein